MIDDGTTLYRFFNEAGALLYVGITDVPRHRFRSHEKAPWWPEAVTITMARHPDRRSAEVAELQAIATERPRWNRQKWNAAGTSINRQQSLFRPGHPAMRPKPKPRTPAQQEAHERELYRAMEKFFVEEQRERDDADAELAS